MLRAAQRPIKTNECVIVVNSTSTNFYRLREASHKATRAAAA